MTIPFDSLCLAAVTAESQRLVGARFERATQTDTTTVHLGFYRDEVFRITLSADARCFRAHLSTRRPDGVRPTPRFATDLQRLLEGSTVAFIRQRGFDRILEIGFASADATFVLIAELMGKHSNLILVDREGKIRAAVKWVGAAKSRRPILPNRPYEPPPFDPAPSLLDASSEDVLQGLEGASPFVRQLIGAGVPLRDVQGAVRSNSFHPVFVPGAGAYPLSVARLGFDEVRRESISQSLEQHFTESVERDQTEAQRRSLIGQLNRVVEARDVALRDVEQAKHAALNARAIQEKGELILAYQSQIVPGATVLEALGYDGQPVAIPVLPDKSAIENAERYFKRAKNSKSRAAMIEGQEARLRADLEGLHLALHRLAEAKDTTDLNAIRDEADAKRWLNRPGTAAPKEERPFGGHAIREYLSPGGWRVLVGENSTANDHLTTKVSRPGDLWFHVRGSPSAHVVLCTNNQSERVQTADLLFAASLAVRHSPQKHSSFVSVDYTQRRYVRKPRGSAPGLAVYTHEKTIHVTA